jgi:anaerobic magnesium-protoporphyrin IX monomethyl ester cyclase
MKVLFVNPPVIRFNTDSPEKDRRLQSIFFKLKILSYHPGFPVLFRFLDRVGIGKGNRFGVRAGSRWPWTSEYPLSALHYPFIMGYAAGLLKSKGFNTHIIDAVADEEYSYSRFLGKVRNEHADIVVIECSTPTIDIDLWMAKEISTFTRVALAGPHLTANASNIQEQHPYISFLLKGEYILSALEMVRSGRLGIYESEVVTDLDTLPFPFRDYDAATRYFDPTMPTQRPQLQVYGSKGCPFKCTFCLWPQTMYAGKVALRKPEKIAEEIRYCVEKYGYRSIFFDDDTFNVGTERISRLCDELKQIGLPWTMMGRLDCSPDWLFDKMVESGCVGMRFGIETFNLEILKKINKGIERVDFKKTLEHLSDTYPQLNLHVTMMKDLPLQTEEIHYNDMEILHGLGFSTDNVHRSYQLSACAPFPGTKMYDDLVKEKGKDFQNYSMYDGGQDTIMSEVNK